MKIVYLTTVAAFLLSTSIAESDWPIGLPGQCHYQHQHRHKLLHPIILEPVVKSQTEKGPLDWFMNMVSRVIKPPIKRNPVIIGPINLPGMAGQVYIRQLENYSPWESNHVVIKMVTQDPVTKSNIPFDSSLSYNRSENSSRKVPKLYSDPINRSAGKSIAKTSQGYENFPIVNKISNWKSNHRPVDQHYSNPYSKPYNVQSLENSHLDENTKNGQEHRSSHLSPSRINNKENYQKFPPMPMTSYRDSVKVSLSSPVSIYSPRFHQARNNPVFTNFKNDRHHDGTLKIQSNHAHSNEPAFLAATSNQHSDYWSGENKEDIDATVNITDTNENEPLNHFSLPFLSHEHIVRTDRMVPQHSNHDPFGKRDKADFLASSNWKSSRDFQQGPMIKFEIDDVRNSEMMTVPEVMDMTNQEVAVAKNENGIMTPRNFTVKNRKDSITISRGNDETVSRGKSAEHIHDQQTDSPAAKTVQSRSLTYKTISRSHRSKNNQNVSSESTGKSVENVNRIGGTDNHPDHDEITTTQRADRDGTKPRNSIVEATHGTTNLTVSNRWRFQEGRQPTRVVKAIYRREPISSTMKLKRGMIGATSVVRNTGLYESSSDG